MDDRTRVKYPKPRILLVDMPQQCEEVLRSAGYNVSVGTFGIPYRVDRSNRPHWVDPDSCDLPHFEEQEVVIANTTRPGAAAEVPTEMPGTGVEAIWQAGTEGLIDPRPLYMGGIAHAFERILRHGGIFVVLLSEPYSVEYVVGRSYPRGSVEAETRFERNSWSFLESLQNLNVRPTRGTEITFDRQRNRLGALLRKGATDAHFSCAVTPRYPDDEHWIALAHNKFGGPVAAILRSERDGDGPILLLPQMPNIATILVQLIEEWCTHWSPRLFPYHEARSWLHHPEYEIPEVNDLRVEIDEVKRASRARVDELTQQMESVRAANADWYILLAGTGDELVGAVGRTLNRLGFQQIVDVDEQLRASGEARTLREDLQIHDGSPILIVDVKGIVGCPDDGETQQAEKHALIRAREFAGTVQALTIINHQRNLPPHERKSQPYRQEIIENAQQTGSGLMTTWDLFRLLRNKELLQWPDAVVKPVLYRTGRIDPVPEHYTQIGTIVNAWRNAFGIVPSQTIHAGSCLAIEAGDLFLEITAQSLEIDDARVDEARAGSQCGVGCDDSGQRFRKGMRVFLISDAPDS